MRSSFYLVGLAAASVIGAGVLAFGCSSSSSPPANNNNQSDAGDAGDAASSCVPLDAGGIDIATTPLNAAWACLQQQSNCGTNLAACAADCTCNNAVLTSLHCIAEDAGTEYTCFLSYPNGLGYFASVQPEFGLLECLSTKGPNCGANVDGGSTDAASDAATDAGTDAESTTDGATDAGSTDAATDAATDGGDGAP